MAKARRRKEVTYPNHIHIDDREAMVKLSAFEILACIASLNGMTSRMAKKRKRTLNEIESDRALERLRFKLAYVIAEQNLDLTD